MKLHLCLVVPLLLAFASSACSDTPTSPTTTDTTTTTTTTVASPVYTEDFVATVPVSGSAFYSFSVTQYGTVTAALTDVSGTFVPSTVTLGLGLGVPSAETCVPNTSINTTKSASAQLSATYQPGVYCVIISDVGNLFSAASVAVTIAYP